ncbi:MAG: potassium transporter TrkG, partial [Phycisphaerae bacterium]|nr:potassium transporter TrkG [Phycisphaerae bacterium]
GFGVLYNLVNVTTDKVKRTLKSILFRKSGSIFETTAPGKIRLQTKIVLLMTLALLVLGTGMTFVFESLPPGGAGQSTSAISQAPWQERLTDSYFLSVTSRTAGFNTTPTRDLAPSTKFFTIVMMVIGASPGSTGGGIKTVTLAIILCSIWSLARGYHQPQAFKRTIHHILVLRAMTVMALAVAVIIMVTMAISAWGMKGSAQYDFLDVLFETTSAFGTVGLTTGHTGSLNGLGRLLVIMTMIIGRLGPLTIFVALPTKESARNFDYPLESVAIG